MLVAEPSAASASRAGVRARRTALPGPGRGDAEAVDDDQDERPGAGVTPARTIAAKPSGSRLAPPTSAPSMSGWAISSPALSGVTLPP